MIVYYCGVPSKPLSNTEYLLMKLLASNPNALTSFEDIGTCVWGGEREREAIHELMSRLRKKIGRAASACIEARSGAGFVFYPNGGPIVSQDLPTTLEKRREYAGLAGIPGHAHARVSQ